MLGITRQTVYHYFANTNELLSAIAADAAATFVDDLVDDLPGIVVPEDAVVEGIALTWNDCLPIRTPA